MPISKNGVQTTMQLLQVGEARIYSCLLNPPHLHHSFDTVDGRLKTILHGPRLRHFGFAEH